MGEEELMTDPTDVFWYIVGPGVILIAIAGFIHWRIDLARERRNWIRSVERRIETLEEANRPKQEYPFT